MRTEAKGQSLVEMALIMPILLLVLLGTTDVWLGVADGLIAKHLTARAARGAALSTVPDGVTSCQDRVASLLSGDYFINADWSYTVTNCPADPYQGITQGTPVEVSILLDYHPSFFSGDPWSIQLATTDYGR